MPRYKGATKYERQEYARQHYNFMGKKHSKLTQVVWKGETVMHPLFGDNYEEWVTPSGQRDQPVPYSHGFIGLKWFIQLIESWPLHISDLLDSEFYGDVCDRKYIRELLRTLEMYGYYDEGAYIEIMAGGSGFSPLPKPKTGEWVEESIYSRGHSNVFKGSDKNRVRLGFVLDWLQEKEEAEGRGEKQYDERFFYDDTEGGLAEQELAADAQPSIAYGASGSEEVISTALTVIGWLDGTNKPNITASEAALLAAAEVLIKYQVLTGTISEQAAKLASRYGLRQNVSRPRLRAKAGEYPPEFYSTAAKIEMALPAPIRSTLNGFIFQAGGRWDKRRKAEAAGQG